MLKFLSLLAVALTFGGVLTLDATPELAAHQESVKVLGVDGASPESTVTITVGEKNGFAYTVNGATYSPHKISVSGEYLNDDTYPARGYARLFLVVDSGVEFYSLRPSGNVLDVYIRNRWGEFFYEILCPPGVAAYHLWEGQINATAVLVTGPSRSQVALKGQRNVFGLQSVKDRRRREAVRKP